VHHAAAASDDSGHAADCEALANCAKASGDKAAAKAHTSMSRRFADSASRHEAASEEFGQMGKAVGSTMTTKAFDPNAIAPDDVKAINTNPGANRAIARPGQPNGDSPAPVSSQFEKLVAIEE